MQLYSCYSNNSDQIRYVPEGDFSQCKIELQIGGANQMVVRIHKKTSLYNWLVTDPNASFRLVDDNVDIQFVKYRSGQELTQLSNEYYSELLLFSSIINLKSKVPTIPANYIYSGSAFGFITSFGGEYDWQLLGNDFELVNFKCGVLDYMSILDEICKQSSWSYYEKGIDKITKKSIIYIGDFKQKAVSLEINNLATHQNIWGKAKPTVTNYDYKFANSVKYLEVMGNTGKGSDPTTAIFLDGTIAQKTNYPIIQINDRYFVQNLDYIGTDESKQTVVIDLPANSTKIDLYNSAISELDKIRNAILYQLKIWSPTVIHAGEKVQLNYHTQDFDITDNSTIKKVVYDYGTRSAVVSIVYEPRFPVAGKTQKLLYQIKGNQERQRLLPKF